MTTPTTLNKAVSTSDGVTVVDCGAGSGGSLSDWSEPPAKAGTQNTPTSASASMNLRIVDSPKVEVETVSAQRRARETSDYNACELTRLHEHEEFQTLMRAGDFRGALAFCDVRLEATGESFRWALKSSIALLYLADYRGAKRNLLSIQPLISSQTIERQGYYWNGLARSCELLGEYDAALRHYRTARECHARANLPLRFAQVDNNTGRCLTKSGHAYSSHFYFDRAAEIAVQFDDTRLRAEIHESRALAYEAEGKMAMARREAHLSCALLEGTEHEDALAESRRTLEFVC